MAGSHGDFNPVAPAFAELTHSSVFPATECVMEIEDGMGAGMRVHLRGCEIPDLSDLCRSFRRRD